MTLNNSGIDAREMALCCCFPCLRLGGNDEETPVPNQTSSSNSGPFGTVSPMHVQREGMLELPERINIRVSDSKKNLPPLSALYIEDNFNILTDLGNGLPSPHGQDEDEYCYHCPICFLNYRGIYRSSCCNNYFCYSCLHEYVASKYGISPQDLQVLQYPFWVDIPCPHCGTEIFEPQYVEKNEGIRSYREKGMMLTSRVIRNLLPLLLPLRLPCMIPVPQLQVFTVWKTVKKLPPSIQIRLPL